MAASTMAATVFSFGLKALNPPKAIRSATLPLTSSFINRQSLSLNLSSSNSICGPSPLVLTKKFTIASPVRTKTRRLTVSCAKGYKMKTHKASAKRFRVTGSGKIMRRRAGKQHLLQKKNTKRKKRLSRMVQVHRSDYNNVMGALPYLKVNRSN